MAGLTPLHTTHMQMLPHTYRLANTKQRQRQQTLWSLTTSLELDGSYQGRKKESRVHSTHDFKKHQECCVLALLLGELVTAWFKICST